LLRIRDCCLKLSWWRRNRGFWWQKKDLCMMDIMTLDMRENLWGLVKGWWLFKCWCRTQYYCWTKSWKESCGWLRLSVARVMFLL
jgi:hypothetical protein